MSTDNDRPPSERLIWIDLEMSGLNPQRDRILELACAITDGDLRVIAESPSWALSQPSEVLDGMDKWNSSVHAKSGLIDRVRASSLSEAEVETLALDFVSGFVGTGESPMCGNSICQDRRFLFRFMPRLEAHFHYRNFDVSVFKEAARRWRPELAKGFSKESKHEALLDVRESIEEMRYYLGRFIVADGK